ncbi:MAG: hypothetical protein MUO60_07360 [Clostridiaceae bacterium]|nr:hypothetical protein [Clostridiaceae bacterium]
MFLPTLLPISTISLATSDQVSKIKNLLTLVQVTDKEIEKILSKANADKWEELNTAQADSTITWLKKKVE